jgi:hypothetical protein
MFLQLANLMILAEKKSVHLVLDVFIFLGRILPYTRELPLSHAAALSHPIVGSDESCDRAIKLVGIWEFLYVLFNKLDGQSYW